MRHLASKDDLHTHVRGIEAYKPGTQDTRERNIIITSGTTKGMPSFAIIHRENEKIHLFERSAHAIYGKQHAVLAFSGAATQNLHRLVTELWRLNRPKRLLVLERHDIEADYFATLIREFKPTQLNAFPTLLVHALACLKKNNETETLAYLRDTITTITFSGEMMTKKHRAIINTMLPNATMYGSYSLSELPFWFIFTCPVNPNPDTTVHCIEPTFTDRVTIHEPDEHGAGEIIIRSRELGWYRTGDAGKIDSQTCACGSKKQLTVMGRINYDIVSCVGALFLISEVDRALGTLDRYIEDYLIEVSDEVDEHSRIRGRVHFHIVPTRTAKNDPTSAATLKTLIEKRLFVTRTKVLRDVIEDGVFLPSTLTFVEKIPRGNKHIRLRRV